MGQIKSALRWMGAKVRYFRDLISGDDLHEAHKNSGYDHEHHDRITGGM